MAFPDPFIVDPVSKHTRTIIMLHGRGSNGPEFAQDLFDTRLSQGDSLRDLLPSYKWVFPTCPPRFAAVFREEITQWYEIYSLTDPEMDQTCQTEGIRDSLEHLSTLISREAQISPSGDVILGGISQGFSIAVISALLDTSSLRALAGFSTWLPRYSEIAKIPIREGERQETRANVSYKLEEALTLTRRSVSSFNALPVFLAHCCDDNVIDIALGMQVRDVLINLGHNVTWLETNNGGHWINEPKGVEGLEQFLRGENLMD